MPRSISTGANPFCLHWTHGRYCNLPWICLFSDLQPPFILLPRPACAAHIKCTTRHQYWRVHNSRSEGNEALYVGFSPAAPVQLVLIAIRITRFDSQYISRINYLQTTSTITVLQPSSFKFMLYGDPWQEDPEPKTGLGVWKALVTLPSNILTPQPQRTRLLSLSIATVYTKILAFHLCGSAASWSRNRSR